MVDRMFRDESKHGMNIKKRPFLVPGAEIKYIISVSYV